MTSYGEKLPSLISRRKTVDKFESDLLTFTAVVGTAFIVGGGIVAWRQGKTLELWRLYLGGFSLVFLIGFFIKLYTDKKRLDSWRDIQP